jgi:hypothetical protein
MANLVDKLEKAYELELPERYRKFIESGEYTKHKHIELAGYIRGSYNLDFTDDLLVDVHELGTNAGIDDMDDVPWEDDFARWVPIASLSHEKVPEPKMFLVLDAESEAVALFHYDGWKICPLNDNFDQFVKELPAATSVLGAAVTADDDDD